jgi:hypothetical protein
MQHQVEAWHGATGRRERTVRGHGGRLAAAGLVAALTSAGAPGHPTGTLIAAFVTRTEILLCSDGRVVDSVSRSTVRDDWPKVHGLTTRTGLLTAGRDLAGLREQFVTKLGAQQPEAVSAVATVLRGSLEAEWRELAGRSGRRPAGRVFAVVAGFDAGRAPRLFYMDSATTPPFLMQPVHLFGAGQGLEVFAIATNSSVREDISALLVRNLDALVRQQPGAEHRTLMLAAFDAAKRELGVRNPTVGGQTFASTITPARGYEPLRP